VPPTKPVQSVPPDAAESRASIFALLRHLVHRAIDARHCEFLSAERHDVVQLAVRVEPIFRIKGVQ
jgi:hypothetical protein